MDIKSIGSAATSTFYKTQSSNTAPTEISANKNSKDQVSISDNAKKARLLSLSGFMDGAGEDGVITLEEMRAFRDKKMDEAQAIIRDTINGLNLQNCGKIKIDIDEYGSVRVTGSSEENNNAIADALQKDDQFRNTYNACSGTSSLLAAAEAAVPFHEAYKSDPKSAVAQYSWLIGKEWDFNMFFENGEAGYSVA